ncbi:MAG: hypothetical protein AMXMBFR13_17630 [Phycisphaerae bacterium]
MKQILLVPELRELLTAGENETLRRFCEEGHPAIVAELVSGLDSSEIWQILRLLPVNTEKLAANTKAAADKLGVGSRS